MENLEEAFTEISRLFKTYTDSPMFGVQCTFDDVEQDINAVTVPRVEDKVEIVESEYDRSGAAYF